MRKSVVKTSMYYTDLCMIHGQYVLRNKISQHVKTNIPDVKKNIYISYMVLVLLLLVVSGQI